VLNAEDPLVVPLSGGSRGSVLFFARRPDHPVLVDHRAQGGKVAFADRGHLLLAEGDCTHDLADMSQIPMSHAGRAGFQLDNILAATAAAWCVGLSPEEIRVGLESFRTNVAGTPARFNVFDVAGRTVIVDHAHNSSALEALVEALDGLAKSGRTIVYSVARDQQEDELIRQATCLAKQFDRVILYPGATAMGGAWSATAHVRSALGTAGSRARQVVEGLHLDAAVSLAFELSPPDELLVIQVDEVTDGVRLVRERLEFSALEAQRL
jgi:cyanophycin synthetase